MIEPSKFTAYQTSLGMDRYRPPKKPLSAVCWMFLSLPTNPGTLNACTRCKTPLCGVSPSEVKKYRSNPMTGAPEELKDYGTCAKHPHKKLNSKGVCGVCYRREWANKHKTVPTSSGKMCTVEGCDRPNYAKDKCKKHYNLSLYHAK